MQDNYIYLHDNYYSLLLLLLLLIVDARWNINYDNRRLIYLSVNKYRHEKENYIIKQCIEHS